MCRKLKLGRSGALYHGAQGPVADLKIEYLLRVMDGERTFIEWSVALDTAPGEEEAWHTLFVSWIPEWTDSLRRTLDR